MRILLCALFSSLIGLCLGAGGSVGGGGSGDGSGRFVLYYGHHIVAVGQKFVITCTVGMNEYLQWSVNGRPIVPGEAGYTMIEGPGPQGYRLSQLTVARSHVFHAGEYKCDPFSENSHSVYVVTGSLTETDDTKLLKGTPIMLTCNPNATDVSTKWKKNETEITGDSHYQMFKNSSLYIASPKESDIGEYSCEIGDEGPNYFHIVELTLHKLLPESTTVLENDKLKLTCQVEGNPIPNVIWIKDGQPLQNVENSTRLVFEENEKNVPNASLLIKPILKSDYGNYSCLIYQYSIHKNTTTLVRVKDIYAALWPFLGIVAEVTILCAIIFIYEKRRIKPNLAQADMDDVTEQKNSAEAKETEVRQRK